ncbi:reverse transcriptase [Gossypium australe]|uniref:Reverse transcriptase n=1 Tax=Gossypium australe TaxID=47621 RepID=A0A5B6W0W9_9ROSI|nr:reverse transcriptase [Gossypium australe]
MGSAPTIRGNNTLPWLVGGDFNDILYAHEKKGGNPREETRMEAFRRTLKDCSLGDIGFSGTWFTWERGRTIERNIRERIDRGVATNSWLQNFPNYSLRHLPHSFSDHCPLLIETEVERRERRLILALGRDTSEFCLEALNNGSSLDEINRTLVVLILKTATPKNLKNFRPISLCTVIYKIIAKTIANRLKMVLEECIDDSQSAFVPGRLITDNVLLAYEVLHSLKNKRTGRKCFMALKLDMSKAYDRVEWLFIEGGLSALIRLACEGNQIRGAKVCRASLTIIHLMFADDCILFGEASNRGVKVFKDILTEYETCSGQCVNFEKSTVFFSSNVNDQDRNSAVQILGVRCSNDPEKYLGLLNMVGHKRKWAFQVLKDRLKQRINNWSIKHISQGENIMSSFWWDKSNGKKGMHWCSWKALSVSKETCGMGFRDLNSFNIALLAKQGWRLLRNPNSLLARTLKAKYYKSSDFLKSELGNLPSFTWKSLWAAKGLILQGMGWRIGDGKTVSIWNDKWIPGNETLNSQNSNMNSNLENIVDLFESNVRKWDEDLVRNTFTARVAEKILSIPLSRNLHEDFVIWQEEPTGEFSVRSGHRLLSQIGQIQIQDNFKKFYKRLWNVDLPAKIKITTWRSFCNCLPNYSNLYYRRLMRAVNCRRCHMEVETREHLFRDCPITKETWEKLDIVGPVSEESMGYNEWLGDFLENNSVNKCKKFACALWGVWSFRNKLIHENEIKTGSQIAEFVSNYLRELDGVKQILPDRCAYTNRWEAPAGMFWRINFDAAFNRQINESCSGLVIRNEKAKVLCSKTIFNKNILTAFAAEALACFQAIDLGLQLELRDVEIEGDARTEIKKLQGKEEDRSEIAAYIKDSKEMALQYRRCVFLFLHREANEVAHKIASEGLKKKENTYLLNRVPTGVESAMMADRRRTETEQEQRRRSC